MTTEYAGPERRGTADEFDDRLSFSMRLEEIERLTKSTHDHLMHHIGQEATTQKAIIDLLETWHGAQFTVRLVKWLAPILAAVGAIALWARDHIR